MSIGNNVLHVLVFDVYVCAYRCSFGIGVEIL